ncbi:MAG TPA: hypothetical protein DCY74_09325, partial [Clostridiales bacterium]|nr:hypothetical protein [Clostridiales bacterium]
DGSPLEAYGVCNMVCVNPRGPWHKQYLENIRALIKHEIDGIFLDGPVMRNIGCYCETCQKDFLEKYGHPIEQATRLELQDMRVNSVTGHIKETREVIDASGKEILLYLNNSALRGDITGSNTRKLEPYVDLLGAEGGFYRPAPGNSIWAVTVKSKLLETIGKGKPVVNFFAGNQSGTAYYMHTAAETRLTYATSYANGANVWYGIHGSPSMFKDSDGAKASKEMNKFVLAHKFLYQKSHSTARVALMWSQDTANNYGASYEATDFTEQQVVTAKEKGDHYGELLSFADMLLRNHTQFDIIDEYSVTLEEIKKYDSIILPNVSCMSKEVSEKLEGYVNAGGHLLATYDTACFDEHGKGLSASRLAHVLGVCGKAALRTSPDVGYMKATRDSELTKGLTAPLLPNPKLNLEWTLAEGAEALFVSYWPLPVCYVSLPEKTYPALIKNAFGKGCAYYITGNFANFMMTTYANADYPQILRNFIAATSSPVVSLEGPGLVEAVLRKIDSRYVLHLINKTGAMARPFTDIVPLHGLKITLSLDIKNPVLKTTRGGNPANLKTKGKKLSFTLDALNEFEVIEIR